MPYPGPSPDNPSPSTENTRTQLELLTSLHDQGALSDFDFAAARANLLERRPVANLFHTSQEIQLEMVTTSSNNTNPVHHPPEPDYVADGIYPGVVNTEGLSRVRASEGKRNGKHEFLSSPTFQGTKRGYIFTTRNGNTGYYTDEGTRDSGYAGLRQSSKSWRNFCLCLSMLIAVGVLALATFYIVRMLDVPLPVSPATTLVKTSRSHDNIMATNKTQHMICENSHTLCDCGMMRPSNSDTPTVCECKGSHATCSCGGADLCVCSGQFSKCQGDRGKLVVCPGGFTKCHKGKAGEMLDHDMFGFLWFLVALTSLYSCVAVPSIIAYYFGQ